jgi:hypothetical protein
MQILLSSCGSVDKLKNIRKPVDLRTSPLDPDERAQKNLKEGKGMSLKNAIGGRGGKTSYEFSTSNPMWRASLETLDFLPLATIDYSGGMIITDWYSDDNIGKESIKISVRFLGNDIASENIKIIIHKKTCSNNSNCRVDLLEKSRIKEELHSTIIRKAALLAKESKNKKK